MPPAALAHNDAPCMFWASGGEAFRPDCEGSVGIYARINDDSRGDLVIQHYGLCPALVEQGTSLVVLDRDEAEVTATLAFAQMASPEIALNAGTLHIRPLTETGREPVGGTSVTIDGVGKLTFHYGDAIRVAPACNFQVTVGIGKDEARQAVSMRAAETITQDVVVTVGVAVFDTGYTADPDMDSVGPWVYNSSHKQSLDGRPASMSRTMAQVRPILCRQMAISLWLKRMRQRPNSPSL